LGSDFLDRGGAVRCRDRRCMDLWGGGITLLRRTFMVRRNREAEILEAYDAMQEFLKRAISLNGARFGEILAVS